MNDKPTAASYGSSAITMVFGAMTFQQWVTVIGLVIGIATFGVNWYYKHKHYQLAQKQAGE